MESIMAETVYEDSGLLVGLLVEADEDDTLTFERTDHRDGHVEGIDPDDFIMALNDLPDTPTDEDVVEDSVYLAGDGGPDSWAVLANAQDITIGEARAIRGSHASEEYAVCIRRPEDVVDAIEDYLEGDEDFVDYVKNIDHFLAANTVRSAEDESGDFGTADVVASHGWLGTEEMRALIEDEGTRVVKSRGRSGGRLCIGLEDVRDE